MTITIPTGDRREHQQWYRRLRIDQPAGRQYDSAWALRSIDRQDVPPEDVVAWAYPTLTLALLGQRANREAYGHPPLGIFHDPETSEWVTVIDLRPVLAALLADQSQS